MLATKQTAVIERGTGLLLKYYSSILAPITLFLGGCFVLWAFHVSVSIVLVASLNSGETHEIKCGVHGVGVVLL